MSEDRPVREIICPKCYETFEDTRKRWDRYTELISCPVCGCRFVAKNYANVGRWTFLILASVIGLPYLALSSCLILYVFHSNPLDAWRALAFILLNPLLFGLLGRYNHLDIFDLYRASATKRKAAEKKAMKAKLAAGGESHDQP